MRRMFALAGTVFALAFVAVTALPAAAATIMASPPAVTTSGIVTLSGDTSVGASHCAAGDTVTLISDAFTGIAEFAGVGAVTTPVDANGKFSTTVTLRSAVRPGTYTISGRCGGGNLGVTATLTVTGLPRTGASFGPLSALQALAGGVAIAGLGGALVWAGRRRDPATVEHS